MFEDVFAAMPPHLHDQLRQAHEAEAARRAGEEA
jgi:2-oxoisovalerate dehydrogenase E1 component alpha subunit